MIEIRESKKNVLDEVVAKNCTIHLERTNKKHWILAIHDHDTGEVHVDFYDCGMVAWKLVNDAEQRNEAVALGIHEACPADRHTYYTLLLSYKYCPYCGERLHS